MILRIVRFYALIFSIAVCSQNISGDIETIRKKISGLQSEIDTLNNTLERLQLLKTLSDIDVMGYPSNDEVVKHHAMVLSYAEEHEQARWVMHIILPLIGSGNQSRTNDFRPDPKIKTGSAEETDYFIKKMRPDSSGYEYEDFGFDRGHLAPSADFKWSRLALSESYYYSNMSPQVKELNRGKWAEMEDFIRAYVLVKKVPVYVVTGPVLRLGLPVVPKAKNHVSVPEAYYKVVIDTVNKQGIAFYMQNKENLLPVESYARSIDEIESITGYNFFPNLTQTQEIQLEKTFDPYLWMPEAQSGNVQPLQEVMLPRGTFNTLQARMYMGKSDKVTICGTVVSTHKSKKGNIFVNLDRKFPNQVFTVAIWSKDVVNFTYMPQVYLLNKVACFTGLITQSGETPQMSINNETAVRVLEIVSPIEDRKFSSSAGVKR